MCGRHVTKADAALEREFSLMRHSWDGKFESFNVAPSQRVPVIRLAKDGEREGVMMRWGLIPFFANGEAPKFSTINARIETIATSACYRGPWERRQRCIIPAIGFYEWSVREDGSKQPFFIKDAEHEYLGIAGLWDRSEKENGEAVESCTIITMLANELMASIHNSTGGKPLAPEDRRMPAIVPLHDVAKWLSGTQEEAREVLRPYPSELMIAWPVSTRANSPKNNDAELIRAIA